MKSLKAVARDSLNKLFTQRGHVLVSKQDTNTLKNLAAEQHLIQLFENLGIDCVIDVGANKGQYYQYLRNKIGFKGLIISFEPIPDNVLILREFEKQDPNYVVYEMALGSVKGEKEFNVMQRSEFSSFYAPSHEDTKSFVDMNKVSRKISVKTERLEDLLDDIYKKHSVNRIFLKMDTQGFDLEVLIGLSEKIKKIEAIQSEVPVLRLYEGAPTFAESVDYLLSRDFFITGLFPVNQDKHLRAYDVDCIAVNGKNCRD